MSPKVNLLGFKNKNVHFIAIGGSSMSGLAVMLHDLGFEHISGSDSADGKNLPRLRDLGMNIFVGHNAENVQGADLVVYSAAISPANCEYAYAAKHGIPMLRRDDLLGLISAMHKNCIGVSGTHGKTTTTSMISQIFETAQKDASIHIGGFLPIINSNVKLGNGETFITEACEYVDSFLSLKPTYAIVLNIDADHLDYFKTLDNIYKSFVKFVQPVPEHGCVIGDGDDALVFKLMQECGKRCIFYGFNNTNDYYPENISFSKEGYPAFALMHKGKELFHLQLNVVGKLNILNAMAGTICALENGIALKTIKTALEAFGGAKRRFEDRGYCNGARLINDYAHHPMEVAAVILGAQEVPKKTLWAVYQPALFSRTIAQFDRLARCFKGADKVIIIDIYGAREPLDPTIHSKMLVNEVIKQTGQDCIYIPTMQEAAAYLQQQLQKDDLCLILGSGTIDKLDSFIKKD